MYALYSSVFVFGLKFNRMIEEETILFSMQLKVSFFHGLVYKYT